MVGTLSPYCELQGKKWILFLKSCPERKTMHHGLGTISTAISHSHPSKPITLFSFKTRETQAWLSIEEYLESYQREFRKMRSINPGMDSRATTDLICEYLRGAIRTWKQGQVRTGIPSHRQLLPEIMIGLPHF